MEIKTLSRRTFMKKTPDGALAAAPLTVFANQAHSKEDESASSLEEGKAASRREVRLEYLRPREIEAAMSECAALFQPLGTIEWHGYQSNVGVDSLKAHRLCVLAAQKGGGLVAPPLYGG
ncbi:MAG: creatininase family protein, partial [Candidatus Hinthialibacter sp.]